MHMPKQINTYAKQINVIEAIFFSSVKSNFHVHWHKNCGVIVYWVLTAV